MRSLALDDGRPAPLWLVLRYLLTGFDGSDSDTITAHRNLGEAMRVLQEIAYLPLTGTGLDADDLLALQVNPEPLKVSFVDAGSELLGRLMQGTDEPYRFSIAFEVRPVMIATRTVPENTLLVGHRYRTPAAGDTRRAGVNIQLDARFQPPRLARVVPPVFAAGDTVQLVGSGFGAGDLAAIGPLELAIGAGTGIDEGRLLVEFADRSGSALGDRIAAGTHALTVVRPLPDGRRRVSNPVLIRVLPTLATAGLAGVDADRRATIDLGGVLLGRDQDDTVVSLWTADRTAASGDELITRAGPAQGNRSAIIRGVAPGTYRVIVRVNGAQALDSPEVTVP
jgi:hypothetical protein